MPKITKVMVSTIDTDLEFNVQPSTTGKQLFDKVVRSIGLREAWYFGMEFIDSSNQSAWVDLAKKLSSQSFKKEDPAKIKFRVKYFPEDAAEELILPLTKQLFFLQVKESVLSDQYYCPAETAVLLGSYALQANHGEYDSAIHNAAFFAKESLLPERVIKQHSITKAEWDDKIIVWYTEHKDMERETAMIEYLKVAQDLDMYGITYYDITNKKGSELWLGVDALGINVYDKSDRLTPKIGFPWAEVNKVSYSGKKFIVKPTDQNSPNFVFLSKKSSLNKRIIALSKGNYEMFSRRRKPDTIEIQQMKAQVKVEQEYKEKQKQLLVKEKEHRTMVEIMNQSLTGELEDYKRKVEMSNEDLERTHRTAEELRIKLEELENTRQELEESQAQANEARQIAEDAVNSVKAEKVEKEQQAAEAQELLEAKVLEAREKEEEARMLQEELQMAREEIVKQQYHNTSAYATKVQPHPSNCIDTRELISNVRHPNYTSQPFENNRRAGDSCSSIDGGEYAKELRQLDSAINTAFVDKHAPEHESHEFRESFVRNVADDDRLTEAEMNSKLGKQLKSLRQELEGSRNANEMTSNDQIYVKNVKQGRDKYKTLKQIRQGNTKIRIETFESL